MTKSLRLTFTLPLAFIASFVLAISNAVADQTDQTLVIDIDPVTSCAISVTLANPEDNNCKKLDKNPCENIKDCVCSAKDKKLKWTADSQYKYTLTFHPVTSAADMPVNPNDDFELALTPFKEKDKDSGCSATLVSSSDGVIDCKAKNKGTWDYDVKVEGCAEGFDPRVVIQN
ncbi:hypothetical protein [Thalassotalea mangrovi]|uniref:Ig-like domain-containing protein n=1 Tax=Thalassotalea mangrovi TaxID=2572245 RepID=A0A4U1B4Z6_9GAMM|nr:hypothetical protein [Thalassotalea mangrovi]TKB45068.1 hypothetical protein E8M12_09540 [Thalassotalea mangrovi]